MFFAEALDSHRGVWRTRRLIVATIGGQPIVCCCLDISWHVRGDAFAPGVMSPEDFDFGLLRASPDDSCSALRWREDGDVGSDIIYEMK